MTDIQRFPYAFIINHVRCVIIIVQREIIIRLVFTACLVVCTRSPTNAQVIQESEPNDRQIEANAISSVDSVEGYINKANDIDWYKLTITASGVNRFHIKLSEIPTVNFWLRLYTTQNQELKSVDNERRGKGEELLGLCLPAGEYLIMVKTIGSEFDTTNPYRLEIEQVSIDGTNWECEPNDTMKQAQAIDMETIISAYAHPDKDEDWYSFKVPEPGIEILVIHVSGISAVKTRLGLYAEDKTKLKEAAYAKESEPQLLVRMHMCAGTYYLSITNWGFSTKQAYLISIKEYKEPPVTEDEMQQAVMQAMNYLASTQTKDGCWTGAYGDSIGVAGLALMAFNSVTSQTEIYRSNLVSTLRYLKGSYHASLQYSKDSKDAARYGGYIGKSDPMYSHAIATLALIETLVNIEETSLEPIITDAIKLILRTQNTEYKPSSLGGPIGSDASHYGGWRYRADSTDSDLSVTGWQILALKAADNAGISIPDWTIKHAAEYVRACFREKEGGFTYQSRISGGVTCARTAMGILSLQMCGNTEDPIVATACEYLLANPAIWGVEEPGEGYPFYYWYYGTRAMMIHGGDLWRIWKQWTCRQLINYQNPDGSWDLAQLESGLNKTYSTSLGVLILGLCCGHKPVYMREIGTLTVQRDDSAEPGNSRNVELIVDASNSMWGNIDGKSKITVAKEVITSIIRNLPDDLSVGLRIYGHQKSYNLKDCKDSQLVVPISKINKEKLIQSIQNISPKGMTPIAYSLEQTLQDFKDCTGEKVIVLVSDGEESCDGNPTDEARKLNEHGLKVKLHIVGFAIGEKATQAQLKQVAETTGGTYFNAADAKQLEKTLMSAVQLTYSLYDASNRMVIHDVLGTQSHHLNAGVYKLIIHTDPPLSIEQVEIQHKKETHVLVRNVDGVAKMEWKVK